MTNHSGGPRALVDQSDPLARRQAVPAGSQRQRRSTPGPRGQRGASHLLANHARHHGPRMDAHSDAHTKALDGGFKGLRVEIGESVLDQS
jgi:hypothetical protein